jgi:lysophospholipase L1-like esterase
MIRGRVVEETAIPASRTVTPNPKALDLFALNLRRIADLAGARGVPVLFSTPPSSIPAGYSPASIAERSYFIVDVATTQHYRDLLAERMRALAAELGGDGRAVRYLHPQLPSRLFLDDCHPSPEGNRLVASNFVRAVAPLIEAGRAGLLAQHKN